MQRGAGYGRSHGSASLPSAVGLGKEPRTKDRCRLASLGLRLGQDLGSLVDRGLGRNLRVGLPTPRGWPDLTHGLTGHDSGRRSCGRRSGPMKRDDLVFGFVLGVPFGMVLMYLWLSGGVT